MVFGLHHTLMVQYSPLSIVSLAVSCYASPLHFIILFLIKLTIFFYNLTFFLVGIPSVANVDLPQESINALLDAKVYHLNLVNARDLDSICIAEAMQCLTKYALHPTFLDPTFSMAIKLAQEMIDQLNQSINKQLDKAMASKANLDMDKIL